jgi:uncharacterized membrane protein YfhO
VDEIQKTLYPTNLAMRGVYVPAGNHAVEFIYEPLAFNIGLYISFGTVLIIVVLLTADLVYRRRHRHTNLIET